MKTEEYNKIIENYRLLRAKYGIQLRLIANELVEKFCRNSCMNEENIEIFSNQSNNKSDKNNEISIISESTIYSLIGFEYQRETSLTKPKVLWISFIKEWINNYMNESKSLICLAKDNRISPAILAQHVLQYHTNYDKNKTKKWFSNTSHINNGKLAFEVMICNLNDVIYGNHSNHITNNTGLVFESEISECLRINNISYMTERDLRSNSFDVTPDFRLNLPIILKIRKDNKSIIHLIKFNQCLNEDFMKLIEANEESNYQNIVINWIECKSLFASLECHSEYYSNQFSSYINRFGNGLVLYKHGFVCDIPEKFTQNIIISDKFPKIIQHL